MLDIDNDRGARAADRAPRSASAASRDQRAGRGRARRADRGGRRAASAISWSLAIEATRARATVGEISDALEQVFTRHRATIRSVSGVYGAQYEGDEGFAPHPARGRGLRPRRGAAAAHPGGEVGPGRARPRRQGDRHRLRRYRFRRRYRAAVPDAGGGRAPGDRERRPRRRRVEPGGRPQAPWCRR